MENIRYNISDQQKFISPEPTLFDRVSGRQGETSAKELDMWPC